MRRYPLLLLVVGLMRMVGDLTGLEGLAGLGGATMISPAPKVFCATDGFETFSTDFRLDWTNKSGSREMLELTPVTASRLRGPYNRRNAYGAVLSYGPVLATDERGSAMFASVLDYALGEGAPLLVELGVDTDGVHDIVLCYDPVAGTPERFPTRIDVP